MTVIQRIEKPACGCGIEAGHKNLISIDEAFARIAATVRPIDGAEDVPVGAAKGRILAHSVRSLGMVPPFDNAAMDGYAIRSSDLVGPGPWRLQVTDRVAAGQVRNQSLASNTAIQVFTGAPVPDGADAVVMQENVIRTGDYIMLPSKVSPRTNIRSVGEDMPAGKIIGTAGQALTVRSIAAFAAAGHATVPVHRRVRVALLITGDEVHQAGQARGPAGIWDVNTPMLSAALQSPEIDLRIVQTAKDSRPELQSQLSDMAKCVDLLITTGGISVGEADHVKPALAALGAETIFSGVALKPGKPVSFGRIGSTLWLGLPGNPLSALVTWMMFGKTICDALSGRAQDQVLRRNVVLSEPLRHTPGRCEMRLARLCGFDGMGREVVEFAPVTHSARVGDLSPMDGLLLVPGEAATLPGGAIVEFLPF
ncbi:molybdopterin molybdotransferase MoeA [Sulfitobacter sp. JB4-11]|uniref:molybdopterin molybdotransferase MoeA n=1 Tax=Sulfitobacter rhodophyticola TaxID=3238304 RepID=UPI0035156A73